MSETTAIHWFRQDLRLLDNPSLTESAKAGRVLPVYILDDVNNTRHSAGAASRWWLHHSLKSLDESLQGRLFISRGDPGEILSGLVRRFNVSAVHWNRCYEPWQSTRDQRLQKALTDHGIDVRTFNGTSLWEPWDISKADKTPYKVFTPYYRRGCLSALPPRNPVPVPGKLVLVPAQPSSLAIQDLELLPAIRWDRQLEPHWIIGEQAAQVRLQAFLSYGLQHYKQGRDYPALPCVSRLSAHLHFGELSPHQAWYAVKSGGDDENVKHFCSELAWREFSCYLLYHFPKLPFVNWNNKYDNFPWKNKKKFVQAWCKGRTGIPIVDAGMRELWQTGYMHNRLRMITGSFLVKNLLQDWRTGEAWFRDCLVDWDLANNSASWQWIAGCGADAAPWFRIFNPVTQGQKFDPEGIYTRRFVPELHKLPCRYLFAPWQAPQHVLDQAGIKLGRDYPLPLVDLPASRTRALEAFSAIKD